MRERDVDTETADCESSRWSTDLEAGQTGVSPELVETCRGYLLLVADQNLDEELRRKVGASDLVQETFLRAQQKFAQFRGTSRQELMSWLRQILLNHLTDENRKYRATEKRQLLRERFLEWGDESRRLPLELSTSEPSPSSNAIANEEAAALTLAMKQLPEDYRKVIWLRTWQRLEFSEVAARMNRSSEAARKLWTRAIERLEKELDWSDD